ncbi:hypothetical protein HPB48_001809 [Haemaphysalis longicornis]|uniref:Uncharacterized protein n=1 Tax=Haemaphysalis longicornis TaxID=44386 RepID=A0A9J6G656_HAELO|nr:hypothetical protein HPB48_001809 [Haemaphysalis longicornis]
MVYACVLLSSFNSLVLAYVLIFLYYSATWSTLPWTECGRDWTDDRCYVKSAGIFSCRTLERMVLHLYKHDWLPEAATRRQLVGVNATDVYAITSDDFGHCINATEVSSQQFFYKRVLGFNSQGKEEEDQPSYQGHLFLAVTVGWCCVFACVHNGVRSLGKVNDHVTHKPHPLLWSKVLSGHFDVNVIVATQFFASFGFGLIAFSVFGFLADSLETHVEDVVTCAASTCPKSSLHLAGQRKIPVALHQPPYLLWPKPAWRANSPTVSLQDCEAALKVSEDWGPRDPDERLRYHAFLKSQGFGRVVSLSEDTAQEAGSQHDSVSLEGNEGGKRSRDAPQPSHADSTVPHNPPAGPAVDPVDVPPTSASSPSGSHVAAVPSPKRTLVVSTSGVIVANVPPSETHDQLPDSNHL